MSITHESIVDGCYNCPLEKEAGLDMLYFYCAHPKWEGGDGPTLPREGNPPPAECPLREETLVTKVRLRNGPI